MGYRRQNGIDQFENTVFICLSIHLFIYLHINRKSYQHGNKRISFPHSGIATTHERSWSRCFYHTERRSPPKRIPGRPMEIKSMDLRIYRFCRDSRHHNLDRWRMDRLPILLAGSRRTKSFGTPTLQRRTARNAFFTRLVGRFVAGRSHNRHRRDDLLLHRRRTSESIFLVERLSFQNGFRTVRQNLERATRSTDQPSICLSDRIQWKKFPRKMERSIARHRRERRKCHSHLRTRRTGMVAQYPRKRCNIQSCGRRLCLFLDVVPYFVHERR